MADFPVKPASLPFHDLRIESGGGGLERFIYGYCPCGWVCETRPGSFAADQIKRAFAAHLRARQP